MVTALVQAVSVYDMCKLMHADCHSKQILSQTIHSSRHLCINRSSLRPFIQVVIFALIDPLSDHSFKSSSLHLE